MINQAALWAGITLAVLGAGSLGFGIGRYPDAKNMPASCAMGIFQMNVAILFLCLAYPK